MTFLKVPNDMALSKSLVPYTFWLSLGPEKTAFLTKNRVFDKMTFSLYAAILHGQKWPFRVILAKIPYFGPFLLCEKGG